MIELPLGRKMGHRIARCGGRSTMFFEFDATLFDDLRAAYGRRDSRALNDGWQRALGVRLKVRQQESPLLASAYA